MLRKFFIKQSGSPSEDILNKKVKQKLSNQETNKNDTRDADLCFYSFFHDKFFFLLSFSLLVVS